MKEGKKTTKKNLFKKYVKNEQKLKKMKKREKNFDTKKNFTT